MKGNIIKYVVSKFTMTLVIFLLASHIYKIYYFIEKEGSKESIFIS